jgi:hypothetical protein
MSQIKPLSRSYCSCFISSCISVGAKRYGDFATGEVPGKRSILNSTCRTGGSPGKSSGNTSAYSATPEHSLASFPFQRL